MTALAVCIPAFNEVEGIAATVESVWATGYPTDLLTVIVAVDGGDSRVCAAASAAGAHVVVVSPNQGSYAARNAAIDAAPKEASVFLFTDADCLVSPEWISEHLRALATAQLSGGGVKFSFAGAKPNPAEFVDSIRHLRQEMYVTKEGFAATCNLAVTRDVLDVMRFDPTLRTGGDAEFCFRALAAGFRLDYTPGARIDHSARATAQALLTKARRISSGARAVRAMRGTMAPVAKPKLGLRAYRLARAAGLRVGPVWAARACLLDYRANQISYAAITAPVPSSPAT